ncbi:hypothetical protein C2S53_012105 [Perilla frutescens var. hirtella]|uniref:Uncharacterized protein n=1 Tax=Perilla frutescens var. hirtella TaxID=608512 RepID=A0AAD4JI96_PERFH|nr:hypothetical protein C2S53_012105 [Perilla frutescens var. hirtella]
MACLNMSSNDQRQAFYNTITGPRISFSNDFLDPQQPIKLEKSYREAPVSSDFEFSVRNYSMISADEVFFNGKMVPLKENLTRTTTLRDELLAGDDDYEDVSSLRLAKGTSRWRERLGLKRSQSGVPKKGEKSVQALGRIDEMKASEMVSEHFFAKFRSERKN